MDEEFYIDEFEYLEEHNLLKKAGHVERPARRKPNHTPKKTRSQIVKEIAEPTGAETGFKTTYKPAIYEEVWLRSSLRSFYDEELITDVLAQVKGGKEASVYRCLPVAGLGMEFVAAKVYRPRQFRNLRNDKMYRAGRPVLTGEGRAVKRTDHRVLRALGKKTAYGMQVEHSSWLLYEYTTLQQLYQAGATVPQPIAVNDNAILMSYHGDQHTAAPTLNQISLNQLEARTLFQQVLDNIELMLSNHLIHGDLSAYNILYWNGEIVIIDFPQITNSLTNPDAQFILQRDINRVCEYFARQGVAANPEQLMTDLWERYVGQDGYMPPELEEEF